MKMKAPVQKKEGSKICFQRILCRGISLLIGLQGIYFGLAQVNSSSSEADVILNLLVQKGVITQQEAEEARKAAQKARSASQSHNASSVPEKGESWKRILKELQLYGDTRLRYEFRQAKDPAGDAYARNRLRYRLRVGVKGKIRNPFYYGFRLETSSSARSSNVTLADDGGPWRKDHDTIRVGQVYLGWSPTDWFRMEAGRIPNPVWSSILVWDSDLCPEGLMEHWSWRWGSTKWFLTTGQFLYDDQDPENPFGAGGIGTDTFLLAWQVGMNWIILPKMQFQVAPAVYQYTGQGSRFRGTYDPATPGAGQYAINDLLVLDLPAALRFEMMGLPCELFGQVAVNLEGEDRAAAARAVNPVAYRGVGDENWAYRVGLRVGKLEEKGDWRVEIGWLHRELFSLDPNLVDSDYFDSVLNLEGLMINVSYVLTKGVVTRLAYGYADPIEKKAPTGIGHSVGGKKNVQLNQYHLLQVDMSYQF